MVRWTSAAESGRPRQAAECQSRHKDQEEGGELEVWEDRASLRWRGHAQGAAHSRRQVPDGARQRGRALA
jgi:hypothetical protein